MRTLCALWVVFAVTSSALAVTFGENKGPKGLFGNGREAGAATQPQTSHRAEDPGSLPAGRPPAGPEASLTKREKTQLAELERLLRKSGFGLTLAQLDLKQNLAAANCIVAPRGGAEPTAAQAYKCVTNAVGETANALIAAAFPGFTPPVSSK